MKLKWRPPQCLEVFTEFGGSGKYNQNTFLWSTLRGTYWQCQNVLNKNGRIQVQILAVLHSWLHAIIIDYCIKILLTQWWQWKILWAIPYWHIPVNIIFPICQVGKYWIKTLISERCRWHQEQYILGLHNKELYMRVAVSHEEYRDFLL